MKQKVKIDVGFVNAYLHRNRFTAKEFSQHLGYSDQWWSVMKSTRKNIIPKETAELICSNFGIEWHELVIEEINGKSNAPQQQKKTEKADTKKREDADFQDFMLILRNLDERLGNIESLLENLQWLKK